MAIIREVLYNNETKSWAYIERSDDSDGVFIILGEVEFTEEKDAREWAKIYEEKYHPKPLLNYGQASVFLREGKKIARKGWNGKGMYLLFIPEGGWFITKLDYPSHNELHSLFSAAFIALRTADSKIVPWTASQSDILARDWEIV